MAYTAVAQLTKEHGFTQRQRVRGDGNCYYRAVARSIIEHMKTSHSDDYKKYLAKKIIAARISEFTDFTESRVRSWLTDDADEETHTLKMVRVLRRLTADYFLRHRNDHQVPSDPATLTYQSDAKSFQPPIEVQKVVTRFSEQQSYPSIEKNTRVLVREDRIHAGVYVVNSEKKLERVNELAYGSDANNAVVKVEEDGGIYVVHENKDKPQIVGVDKIEFTRTDKNVDTLCAERFCRTQILQMRVEAQSPIVRLLPLALQLQTHLVVLGVDGTKMLIDEPPDDLVSSLLPEIHLVLYGGDTHKHYEIIYKDGHAPSYNYARAEAAEAAAAAAEKKNTTKHIYHR